MGAEGSGLCSSAHENPGADDECVWQRGRRRTWFANVKRIHVSPRGCGPERAGVGDRPADPFWGARSQGTVTGRGNRRLPAGEEMAGDEAGTGEGARLWGDVF